MMVYRVTDTSGDTYCIDCTKIVSAIFGKDLIKEAKLILPGSDKSEEECLKNAQKIAEIIYRQYEETGNFWFDSNELIIDFINGKSIRIKSSEWGSIDRMDFIYSP